MRSQTPSMVTVHEDPMDSSKSVGSILSPCTSPISSSESGITVNRQKISPTSKCAIWKQRNEVKINTFVRSVFQIVMLMMIIHFNISLLFSQNQFSNSTPIATIEANNKNKLKSAKGTTSGRVSPTNKIESNVVMQDVLSIKSYLHKLSRILQVCFINIIMSLIEFKSF